MRISYVGPLLVALSLTSASALRAQEPAQTDSAMTIHVTVTAHNGDPVAGLTKDDFTLTDNKHPEPITDVRALSDSPTGIFIVLDAINLPYSEVSYARQQLGQFFSSNARLPQPTALGVLLNDGLKMQPGFSTDGAALRADLDKASIGLREIPRSAGVYGAEERLQISLNMFKALMEQLPKDGMKRVIWISPGWPLLSGPGIELSSSQQTSIFSNVVAINTELRRSQIIVDAVNPGGASEDVGQTNYYETFLRAPRTLHDVEIGQLGLQVIAQQSGGLVLNGSNDIAGLIQHAMQQTKGGYELTFTPAPGERNNEYHELQVKVRRPGMAVRTNAGYYAKPVYPGIPQPSMTPTAK